MSDKCVKVNAATKITESGCCETESNCHTEVDLSMGFPDYKSYPEIEDALRIAIAGDQSMYQYARPMGHLRLVNALATYLGKVCDMKAIDPLTEILITPGTDYAMYLAVLEPLSEGDELILLEPFFTAYSLIPKVKGAKVVYVPLKPKPGANEKGYTTSADWVWDEAQLEAAFTPKTKVLVICNPSNPLGKVFSIEELNKVASLCIKYNVVCISDEVYHGMVYEEGFKHTSIASLPGMWERTLTLGSAGKLLSVTGLKVGWMVGNKSWISRCYKTFQLMIVVCASINQEATAISIENELLQINSPECYFHRIKNEARKNRNFLAKRLIECGLEIVVPQGGYFIMANISKLANMIPIYEEPDLPLNARFERFMAEKGLTIFPCTMYFNKLSEDYENYIRICYMKKEETLQKAIDIFKSILHESK